MNILRGICTWLSQFVDNVAHMWEQDPAPREITGWELRNKLRLADLDSRSEPAGVTVPPEIVTPARGTKGQLLYLYEANTYVFRVYAGGSFKDYDVRHCDLSITIDDDDACFYEGPDRRSLDHAPETLGRT